MAAGELDPDDIYSFISPTTTEENERELNVMPTKTFTLYDKLVK